jgi:hypothetical protein
MLVIAIHLLIGLVAGTVFGVQTLLVLALLVLVEGVGDVVLNGFSVGIFWWVGAEVSLQLGYLGGIFVRSMIERIGGIAKVAPKRFS